jgi:hypothetical protein
MEATQNMPSGGIPVTEGLEGNRKGIAPTLFDSLLFLSKPYTTGIPPDYVFCLARWFLARLILDPEDGGDTFLRKVGYYTALCPGR